MSSIVRSMARHIARLRMEQAGIQKPGKKMRWHWREYAPKRRR